ncbi:hypothetical protein [Lyngbya sp. CCY1209]|uniref:hypothetical protein n=1 Tax=Lyngbya sp. CCY1209 TaxID=2886103 RepID=UPI002D215A65|nr:hypothetical protein [Lyngbya sp. CCY1209]MEB3886090.1 hypothetical protein [Lyngbya sp. CCY1209]
MNDELVAALDLLPETFWEDSRDPERAVLAVDPGASGSGFRPQGRGVYSPMSISVFSRRFFPRHPKIK